MVDVEECVKLYKFDTIGRLERLNLPLLSGARVITRESLTSTPAGCKSKTLTQTHFKLNRIPHKHKQTQNSKSLHHFSYHHPQHFPDSIIERRVFDRRLYFDGMFSFLHGNDDEGNWSSRLGPNSQLLAVSLALRGRAAHMFNLDQVHAHLNKRTMVK